MQVYSDELYHYGVIGMKWGVVRSLGTPIAKSVLGNSSTYGKAAGRSMGAKLTNSVGLRKNSRKYNKAEKKLNKMKVDFNDSYNKKDRVNDYSSLGKKGVKRINKDITKGRSHSAAVNMEIGRQATTSIVKSIGTKAVASALVTYAGVKIQQHTNRNLLRLAENPVHMVNAAWEIVK